MCREASMRSVECPSARGGDATRRRGARKATRARARGFASGGDGRYSDRAAGREGARSACAAPFRSPRSQCAEAKRRAGAEGTAKPPARARAVPPSPRDLDRACAPDAGAASRPHRTRRGLPRRGRARRQMSICGAVRARRGRPLRGCGDGCPGIQRRRLHKQGAPHGRLRTRPGVEDEVESLEEWGLSTK